MVYIIILIICFFIVTLLFMPFYIDIKIQRENNNDKFELKILLFKGLVKFGIDIPFIDLILLGKKPSIKFEEKIEKGNKEKDISKNKHIISFKKIINYVERGLKFRKIALAMTRYLKNKMQIIKIIWKTSIGFENAAITGLISGGLWSIKSCILAYILNDKKVRDVNLNVIPHYNKNVFETYIHCIIKLKLVYIIIAGLNGLKVKLKGGEVDE